MLRLPHYSKLPYLFLALLITGYSLYFSWYTLHRHNTLNSYAADLSLIDQPLWNTVRGPGGFMEQTWGERQQPRLAEHFEPLLIPLAALFFLWNDVRILLVAQSLALALGALPVFWIARQELTRRSDQPWLSSWGALIFSLAYLLFPHLQAANIADFHADPFVVTPLLLAFWYATQGRWRWLWVWAGVALLTKETLPPLVAMLGLLLILDHSRFSHWLAASFGPSDGVKKFGHGLALIAVSTAWFLIATFLIVAPLARHYFGTPGPIYLAHRFSTGVSLLEIIQDPNRWAYLAGLFAAVGVLPLLAPELLLLGAPVLAANLLSNFPGQYSGEQHYSAPLVVAFILAAIYGAGRFINIASLSEDKERNLKNTLLVCACLWLASWSLAYHSLHGWTPLSIRTESYVMTPAAQQLPHLLAQIPAEAVISASPGVHPHLAHRRVAYVFPVVQEADYLLVDVTDISGVHPNDVRSQLLQMLTTEWRLLHADTGLIFARRSSSEAASLSSCFPPAPLPCSFYKFTYSTSQPIYPTELTFGGSRLRLLGYDVLDDPDDGVVFRFYWQSGGDLPTDLSLWPLIYDDLGQLLSDPTQVPMITTVWSPPHTWPAGEIRVTETLPQLLPETFHLGLAVGPASSFATPAAYWPVSSKSGEGPLLHLENWVQLASFTRQGPFLTHLPPTASFISLQPAQVQFGSVQLAGFWFDRKQAHPGQNLPLLLQWQTSRPLPLDLTLFIHLIGPDGQQVAQTDAFPTWLTPQPTSRWQPHQLYLSHHTLTLPANLPAGTYQLQMGLYDAQTLERLPLSEGGDILTLGQLEIE